MRLVIENLMSIRKADITFGAPMVLICGNNRVGKSTVLDAIRLALGAGARELTKQSQLKLLVSSGESTGRVAIGEHDRMNIRNVYSAEYGRGGPEKTLTTNPAWPVALDPERVARIRGKDLLKLAIQVTGSEMGADELAAALAKEEGVTPEVLGELRPYLEGTIDGAIKWAKQQAADARGAWIEVTGDTFGSVKSDGWRPEEPLESRESLAGEVEELFEKRAVLEGQARPGGLTGPCPHCGEPVSYLSGQFIKPAKGGGPPPPEAAKELEAVTARIREIERLIDRIDNLDTVAARAQELYDRWRAFSAAAKALEPDQIPSKVASRALSPINDRMRAAAKDLLVSVVITPDGEVEVGGRPYGLLSVSERWRANVLIAEAISHHAGVPIFLVDQLDWVAPQERGRWLKWLAGVSGSRTLTAVACVMAEPKVKASSAIDSYWVDAEGQVSRVVA